MWTRTLLPPRGSFTTRSIFSAASLVQATGEKKQKILPLVKLSFGRAQYNRQSVHLPLSLRCYEQNAVNMYGNGPGGIVYNGIPVARKASFFFLPAFMVLMSSQEHQLFHLIFF